MKEQFLQIQLLPYKYKQAGKWVLLAGLPIVAAIIYTLITSGVITDSRSFFDEWNYAMVYYPIIVGLAFLVFSEEQHEDEMVQSLRYKAFMSGVFFLVIALLFLPFYSHLMAIIRNRAIVMPDIGGMLGTLMLLLVYIYSSFKYNLYRTRKALETDEE